MEERTRQTCDQACRLAAALVEAPSVVLAFNASGEADVVGFSDGRAAGTTGAAGLSDAASSRLRDAGVLILSALEREPQLLDDEVVLRVLGASAVAALPIHSTGHLIGGLCAFRRAATGWTDEDLRALRKVAESAKPGLELRAAMVDAERVRRSRDRILALHHAVLEADPDGVLIVDREGRVVDSNDAFAELWGSPDARLGAGDDERLLELAMERLEDPEHYLGRVREMAARPESESTDRLRFRDGRVVERISRPLRVDGRAAGRIWRFRLVTD